MASEAEAGQRAVSCAYSGATCHMDETLSLTESATDQASDPALENVTRWLVCSDPDCDHRRRYTGQTACAACGKHCVLAAPRCHLCQLCWTCARVWPVLRLVFLLELEGIPYGVCCEVARWVKCDLDSTRRNESTMDLRLGDVWAMSGDSTQRDRTRLVAHFNVAECGWYHSTSTEGMGLIQFRGVRKKKVVRGSTTYFEDTIWFSWDAHARTFNCLTNRFIPWYGELGVTSTGEPWIDIHNRSNSYGSTIHLVGTQRLLTDRAFPEDSQPREHPDRSHCDL